MPSAWEALEQQIQYRFQDRDLLRRALTHASHAYEAEGGLQADNERLEFLGDAVLGLLTSEYLLRTHPGYREGQLSAIKNYLVSASHLHQVAERLKLGEYLLLGRGEELSGGRSKAGLLADAVEALIAAIYLDGGLEAARSFVTREILEDTPAGAVWDALASNYKGALQQTARRLNLPAPRYTVVDQSGPPHAPHFVVEVRLGERFAARGEGASKKTAGQRAAQAMLRQLLE